MTIKKTAEQKYTTKVIDHLGLVAGMCEELGISSLIDQHLPSDSPDKILSTGKAVEAMLLNGLGFVSKTLYLTPQFFKNKPVDKLLNVSYLESEHLNDDALGRALDTIYEYGASKLYALISHQAIKHLVDNYGLEVDAGQLDNTNFHLHGSAKSIEQSGECVLEITRGHSKDHRPDLVQIGLQLIVEHRSRIPMMMKILSGNAEESKSYGAFIKDFTKQLQNDYHLRLVVVDSKLYNQANLGIVEEQLDLCWLTRVPNGLTIAKQLITNTQRSDLQPLADHEGYHYQIVYTDYGAVAQRWLVLHHEEKEQRDLQQLDKRFLKHTQAAQRDYKKLTRQSFTSKTEALKFANKFSSKLKFNNLEDVTITSKAHYNKAGKPTKGQQPDRTTYYIQGKLADDLAAYEVEKDKLGYFILATNELNEEQLGAEQLLTQYKNQSSVERAFRFLKDPNLMASSLFVQKPERMMALLMVMTLCLLVYSALEFTTRALLKKKNLTFPNQLGKPIQHPTMRWIFQCFEGIHLLYLPDNKEVILNVDNRQRIILNLLGGNYLKFYT